MALLTLLPGTCLQVEKWVDPKTGQSTGRIKGPDSLLRAVWTLINRSSVNAIAVVARFPDEDIQFVDDYREGMVAIETIYVAIQTCVYSLILYSMIGFHWRVDKFLWFYYYFLEPLLRLHDSQDGFCIILSLTIDLVLPMARGGKWA
ncbi:hypothetical protein Vadar_008452 [Vaccinium darrowii]|uniref:Uncharacterized protein n=1 Tax=Vaccinium darrowii TaxID=229202 RepID=A0ACB7XXP8_9ERIC|nr:hypothetical protein Vadar_008452 [Vaccinium darrowii]